MLNQYYLANEVDNFRTVGMAPVNKLLSRCASWLNAVMPPSSVGMLRLSLLLVKRPKFPPRATAVMHPSSVGTEKFRSFDARFK